MLLPLLLLLPCPLLLVLSSLLFCVSLLGGNVFDGLNLWARDLKLRVFQKHGQELCKDLGRGSRSLDQVWVGINGKMWEVARSWHVPSHHS